MRSSSPTSQLPAERALVAAIRAAAGERHGRRLPLGIGDDCAVLRPSAGSDVVVTTDFSLEGTHFRRDWHSPESAGHRCLARGLSDLAAMGATPLAAFLSLAVPAELTIATRRRSWVERFLDGLLALAHRHRVPLAGGDTAQSPSGLAAADIVLVGELPRGHALLRSAARQGDFLYVTGALGGAAAELLLTERQPARSLRATTAKTGQPHLFPQPRLEIGAALLRKKPAHAAIDLSDGLSTDLMHLCEESGLNAEIEAAAIPLHPLALQAQRGGLASSALEMALHGGEDYELLFTASPETKMPRQIGGVPITRIGRMLRPRRGTPRMKLIQPDGSAAPLEAHGWEHFRAH